MTIFQLSSELLQLFSKMSILPCFLRLVALLNSELSPDHERLSGSSSLEDVDLHPEIVRKSTNTYSKLMSYLKLQRLDSDSCFQDSRPAKDTRAIVPLQLLLETRCLPRGRGPRGRVVRPRFVLAIDRARSGDRY